MRSVFIFNETNEKLDKFMKLVKKVVSYALKVEGVKKCECNIIFVDNKKIHEINKEYRNIDRATDVISFALEDNLDFKMDVRILGDIYISIDKAREQSLEFNHSLKREVAFLAVHGILHLLGYDHMKKEDEDVMFRKQEEVLKHYGIVR